MRTPVIDLGWTERTSASEPRLKQTEGVFESFFERTFDAVWLFDPQTGVFVDCNQAAIDLIGAKSKAQVLGKTPEDFSPVIQPTGMSSSDKTAEITAMVEKQKGYRFEWVV